MILSLLVVLMPLVCGDVIHILPTTPEPQLPPRPYAFGYAAGRFQGHIDRTHSEISDGLGTIKGSYSYVDPRHQIRTVEYVADKDGFRPVLNKNPLPIPLDTPIVALAKQQHLQQYDAIAQSHQVAPALIRVPLDSVSVHNAKLKHFNLYQQIAEEHARIAAERKALEVPEPNYIR
ncbi:hypothetical protein RN001_010652 [Aquatica leii]|uniref:Uncharacterized protein n=1 Tax=Aquatica leii TaxID=1421715 RepID=A0AAN7S8N2_9COLE|nr:hypothetical protein RN001_010652 [Aquatica leii]